MASKPTFTPRLVVIEGNDKGKIITLKEGTTILGRSKADILVQDPRISRSHIAIHVDKKTNRVTFTDLKSLNGTLINGEPKAAGELLDGNTLQLGNTTFDCQMEAVPAETLPSEKASPLPSSSTSKRLASLKKAYTALPPRVRLGALGALTLVLGYFYLQGGSSSETLEREVASVKQLEAQGRLAEAISKAEKLKDRFPKNAKSYIVLGDLYASQRQTDLAIESYKKAHQLPPPLPLVHIKLVRMYLRLSAVEPAQEELKHIDEVIKTGPHNKELFLEMANLFLESRELKQPPEKLFILAKALQTEFAPDNPIGFKLEAQALFQQDRVSDAVIPLEQARKLDPKDEWVLESLAFAKLSMKDLTAAASLVEEWLKLKPNSTKALLVMAYLRFNERNNMEALKYAQKILQLSSNNPKEPHLGETLNLVGQIYWQQNQLQEAENTFRQACEVGYQLSCDHELVKGPPVKESDSQLTDAEPEKKSTGPAPASNEKPRLIRPPR